MNSYEINLSGVVERLKGQGMEGAENAVNIYRQFLNICAENPKMPLVPTIMIDRVWHEHMLDPVAYCSDTTKLCGRVLPHQAGVYGTKPWLDAWEKTRQLAPYEMAADPLSQEDNNAGADCFRPPL